MWFRLWLLVGLRGDVGGRLNEGQEAREAHSCESQAKHVFYCNATCRAAGGGHDRLPEPIERLLLLALGVANPAPRQKAITRASGELLPDTYSWPDLFMRITIDSFTSFFKQE